MVIQNPYSEIPHKVFNRTFLQEVSASIKFVETPLLNNKEAITHFLKSNFGIIEDFPGALTVGGITLSAETAVERYSFSTTSASLTLDASIYRCYKITLAPKIKRLVEFLKALGIEKIEALTIFKKNLFKATSPNAYSSWRFALHESFKDESLRELAANSSVSDKPFKITIEGAGKFDGGEVRVPFLVEVVDKDNFHFQMDLIGTVYDIDTKDIIANADVLNHIIFSAFCNTVSDKTINLLQQ